MSKTVTPELVLEALSHVLDPEIKKDLVSLNMIQNVTVDDENVVSLTIVLTTPACPLKNKIKTDVTEAVMAIESVKDLKIEMSARVRSDGQQRKVKLPIKNVVAVASGKGGVGKSTVAVNLAVALARSGATVGIMDADIYGPNLPTMMGVTEPPSMNGDKIVPPISFGVKVISIGFFVPLDQPLIWRGPMLHNAIRQFVEDVEWGELDYLIVDLPPGTGDVQLSLTQHLPLSGGIIITLPQQVSIEDARRGLYMFEKLNVPVMGVVENMSYLEGPDGTRIDVFGSGGGKSLAEEANVAFLGEIPMDPRVRIGGDEGEPIVIAEPENPSAIALNNVAEKLAGTLSMHALKNAEILAE
ncbi:MAG: P-loop NTPase [Anaerolineae bacterium]|nr:P-loop NTPase [Anaerolineae bacterium]